MVKNKFKNIDEKSLSDEVVKSLIKSAVVYGYITVEKLNSMTQKELKKCLLNFLKQSTSPEGELNITIDYSQTIFKEANSIFQKNNHQLALILYATAIEHMLNDIIFKKLINKICQKKK